MQVTPGGNASSQTNSCCKSSNSLPYTPLHTGRWLEINAVEWTMRIMPRGNASHQTNSCALQVIRPKVKVSASVPHTPITPHRKMTGNKCSGMSHAGHARWKWKSPNKRLCTASHQTKSKSHPLFLTHTHHSHTRNKCNGVNHAGHARWKCKSPSKLLSLQVIRHTHKKSFPLFLTHHSPQEDDWE